MNLNNFVYFGTFELNNCIIRSIKPGYQGEIFLTLTKDTDLDNEEFIGVILQENKPMIDLIKLEREGLEINPTGAIFKNPSTHKLLYVINDSNALLGVNQDQE